MRAVSLTMTAALMAVSLAALTTHEAMAQGAGPEDAAFSRVAQCVADAGRLSLLALVDESASLDTTDPEDLRTNALEAVVRNLGSVVASTGGDVSVDLQLAAFSTDFVTVRDWSAVTPDNLSGALSEVRQFADRDDGIDTDFAHAFEGARDEFDAVAGSDTCRVLLTFTDGEYDLEPRSRTTRYAPDMPLDQGDNPAEVVRRGRDVICEPDGLADDLHDNDVVTVTVGLSPSIAEADQEFLAGVSEGRSGDCGSNTDAGLGAYIGADDLDGLLFAFDRASTGFVGGSLASDEEVVPCELEACPSGTTTFELDESLRQFHALVTAPSPLVIQLTGPTGETTTIDPSRDGSLEMLGADLSWVALSGALVIDGRLDPEDRSWVGEWQVTFIDPTGQAADTLARAQVTLFGTLKPALRDIGDARIGDELSLTTAMVDAEGTPRTPRELLASTELSVTLRDPTTGREISADVGPPSEDGEWVAVANIPDDIEAAGLEAIATLSVTTVGGVTLPDTRDVQLVNVLPPASFPRVEPAVLSFDAIHGDDTGTAALRVVGGDDPGCVWLDLGEPTSNRDVGTIRLEASQGGASPESCIAVGPEETAELPLALSRDGSASGSLDHSITVHLTSEASNDELQQQVALEADFVRVVDEARRLWIFLLVLVLGLLIPLAFLYAVNRYTARFRDPMFVRYARTPVRVTDDDIVRRDPDEPLHLDSREFRPVQADVGDQTEVDVETVRLRPRVPLWPFSPPIGVASAEGRDVVASKGFRRARNGTIVGELGFALPSSWVFVRDRVEDDGMVGTLYSFINEGTPFADIREQHIAKLHREVPGVAGSMPTEQPEIPDDEVEESQGWTPPAAGSEDAPTSAWSPPTESPSFASEPQDDRGAWSPAGEGTDPPPRRGETDEPPSWRPPTD